MVLCTVVYNLNQLMPASQQFGHEMTEKSESISEYKYRRIAKTPRPLLYLELEYSSRKMQKNILCYLVKSQIQL